MLAIKLQEVAGNATQPAYIEDVFSTYLYTGNGSTQTITNGIDLSGKGGLVWTKARTGTGNNHILFDSARSNFDNFICTDLTQAGTAFDAIDVSSTGFSFKSSAFNNSGTTYASWTFRKQPKFYTQELISHTNGTATNIDLSTLGTVGYLHAKITNTTGDWIAWHRSLTAGNNLRLNTTAAQSTTNAWLSVSGTTATLSASAPTGSYIVHAFAHNAGGFGLTGTDNVISCGSYTASNPTVTLGWEPQWILYKATDSSATDWGVADNMRGMPVSGNGRRLFPNSSAAEFSQAVPVPTATGFIGTTDGPSQNYIYIAIRRGPMKVPTDGTKVLSLLTNFVANNSTWASLSSNGTQAGVLGGAGTNAVDLILSKSNNQTDNWLATPRLTGFTSSTASVSPSLSTNTTAAESVKAGGVRGDAAAASTGLQVRPDYSTATSVQWVNYIISRAPGFFDEVCYTGTGSATTQAHNLGVAPELMIVKCRNLNGSSWDVYSQSTGAGNVLLLNGTIAAVSNTTYWNSVSPTSTVFTVGTASDVNESGATFVAYLFASCPGVSKVGSYTGTGTTQQINCGFTGGARFVLIKRTNSTGDWYVWDSARGIVTGNDPYLLLNSTAAEVTTTDYIDPYSAGFEISSTAPAAINASGGSFIYLAIA